MSTTTQKPAGRGIPDLLYSQAEEDLRSAVRSVLDGAPVPAP